MTLAGTETPTGTGVSVQRTHEKNASTHGTQKSPTANSSQDVPELMEFHDYAIV